CHRLLHHADGNGGLAVEADADALVERTDLDARDIAHPDRIAVHLADDDGAELFGGAQVGLRQHREFHVAALYAAGRNLDILPAQRALDILRRQIVGRQARGIEPDAHGIAAFAEDPRFRHAADRLQPVLHIAVGEVGQLHRRMAVRGKGDVKNRLRIGLDLRHDRLVDLVGQLAAHAADAVAHVVGGGFRVARQLESHDHQAPLRTGDGTDEIDAFDAGDRFLQHAGHLAFDDLGAGAAIQRLHQHHRRIDIRVFADREARESHQADQHHDETEHRREDRTADAEIGTDDVLRSPDRRGPDVVSFAQLLAASGDAAVVRLRADEDFHRAAAPKPELRLRLDRLAVYRAIGEE